MFQKEKLPGLSPVHILHSPSAFLDDAIVEKLLWVLEAFELDSYYVAIFVVITMSRSFTPLVRSDQQFPIKAFISVVLRSHGRTACLSVREHVQRRPWRNFPANYQKSARATVVPQAGQAYRRTDGDLQKNGEEKTAAAVY